MITEIKPARRRVSFSFIENKDYIKTDKRDKWVGVALALAAVAVLTVSFWGRMQ